MFRKLLLLGVVLGLSACATNPPMKKTVGDDMRANDVAVAFAYPEQKINYDELVYKVLWNEIRSTTASFKGIWDIDRDLSGQFAQAFRAEGLKAVAAIDVLDEATYEHLSERLGSYNPSANSEDKLSIDQQVRTALLDEDIEYLVAIRCTDVHVKAFSLGMDPRVRLMYVMNIVDLRKDGVQYTNPFMIAAQPDVDKSPREIEDNGLEKLRAALSESLKRSFEKGVVPKQLGMASGGS